MREIFVDKIVPAELSGAESRRNPAVVFLMGQQGAGKTRVADRIAAALEREGGFVDLDSDIYKAHHPDYDRIMTRGDRMMAAYLGPSGQSWMKMAQEYSRENRLNSLVQTTAQNPEFLAQNIGDFRRAGYKVSVPVMGVPEAMSQQGILNRYHEQSKDGGAGRLTVPEKARLSVLHRDPSEC